jgi:hypothetical protein
MKWKGFSNWRRCVEESVSYSTGEEGVLINVEIAEAGNTLPVTHLVLTLKYRGNSAPAVLLR